jgi:hypothetical protein
MNVIRAEYKLESQAKMMSLSLFCSAQCPIDREVIEICTVAGRGAGIGQRAVHFFAAFLGQIFTAITLHITKPHLRELVYSTRSIAIPAGDISAASRPLLV